jgi:serine/threonine-protein kinase
MAPHVHYARFMRNATLPITAHEVRTVPVARGSRQFGDHAVLAPLARGGMGGVYMACHVSSGARVALKVLDPQFANHPEIVGRLYGEHAIASRIRHPNVLDIRGAARTAENVPYLVMEYLDGENLGDIAEQTTLSIDRIISIGAQVASAVAALHDAGVVHCDIKPDNIFVLAGSDQVKVIDFGVSRLTSDPPTDDGAIAGTPWCMAPEQWDGAPVPASDVYALGCTLYELVTGTQPFTGSLPELMLAHLEQRPARPSWLRPMPIALERLILRSLAKDPAQRPTMHELAYELATLGGALAPSEASPGACAA